MLALLLQIATLFPATHVPVEADAGYGLQLTAMAATAEWKTEQVDALRAAMDSEAKAAAVAAAIADGTDAELRLAALLAAGSGYSWLDDALYSAACTHPAEAPALACLLAADDPSDRWWPALLMLAQDPLATLPVRAAAVARLLDGGLIGAWPFARSILLTGTAADEPAPWADWKRGGRYELPKRILVLSLDRVSRHWQCTGVEIPCGIEPNAAWAVQVEQVHAFEARIWIDGTPRRNGLATDAPPSVVGAVRTVHSTPVLSELYRLAENGDSAALRAAGILLHGTSSSQQRLSSVPESDRPLLAIAAAARPR